MIVTPFSPLYVSVRMSRMKNSIYILYKLIWTQMTLIKLLHYMVV